MIYLIIFLLLVFICFMVLLKTLDIFYLKTFSKTVIGLFIIFFAVIFPFMGTYYLARIFSPNIAVSVFEVGMIGHMIRVLLNIYFVPIYIFFALISLGIILMIEFGRDKKQTTEPYKVLDGPDVREDRVSLKKKNLNIRNLTRDDMHHLEVWLTTEEILEFYNGRDCNYDKREIERHYYNDNNICRLILMLDGKAIGYMQYYPLTKVELTKYHFGIESKVFGIDLFIGIPELLGKGYGSQYIKMICDYLMNVQEVNKIVVDPMIHNKRAIRCYEKCGFETQQLLPRHELHEGVYHDCYLMVYDGTLKAVEKKVQTTRIVEEPMNVEVKKEPVETVLEANEKAQTKKTTTKSTPKSKPKSKNRVKTDSKKAEVSVTPKKKASAPKKSSKPKKEAPKKKPASKKTTKQTAKKNNS